MIYGCKNALYEGANEHDFLLRNIEMTHLEELSQDTFELKGYVHGIFARRLALDWYSDSHTWGKPFFHETARMQWHVIGTSTQGWSIDAKGHEHENGGLMQIDLLAEEVKP